MLTPTTQRRLSISSRLEDGKRYCRLSSHRQLDLGPTLLEGPGTKHPRRPLKAWGLIHRTVKPMHLLREAAEVGTAEEREYAPIVRISMSLEARTAKSVACL